MSGNPGRPLLVVLHTLCAEGTPVLALQLCRHWRSQGIAPVIALLEPEPADLRAEVDALGVPVVTFQLGSGLGRYLRLFWQSWRLCRRLRPFAVLSFPLGWHAPIAWGARLAGVPRLCAHVGNLPPVWTGSAFRKFLALVQLGRPVTHRLLCCSAYIRSATVRDFRLRPREAVAIDNACDLDAFAALPRPAAAAVPPRIGMVARLEEHKDQPTLIRAVALLRDRGLPVQLQLIGEGSRRPQLEALIAQLGLVQSVQLLGSRRDIPALLSQLDLFVFAALPDEGFGIALAEAMAAGLPIVATAVGACREVLGEGARGLLVAPGSAEALADGIASALADPEGAASRAAAARRHALGHYSVAAMAAAYGRELGL
jgi:glycosyltransferase involved in cell wall biosynthesis